jgi:hypothetical protein
MCDHIGERWHGRYERSLDIGHCRTIVHINRYFAAARHLLGDCKQFHANGHVTTSGLLGDFTSVAISGISP